MIFYCWVVFSQFNCLLNLIWNNSLLPRGITSRSDVRKSEGDGNLDGAEHTLLVYRDNSGGAPHLTHCQLLECKEKLVIRSAEGGGGGRGYWAIISVLPWNVLTAILPFSQHSISLMNLRYTHYPRHDFWRLKRGKKTSPWLRNRIKRHTFFIPFCSEDENFGACVS